MQSLMHACIFCISNPRGLRVFFASYVLSGSLLCFRNFGFIIFSIFSNEESVRPHSVFHRSNFSVVPSFVLSSLQFGISISCDLLTCPLTSTSPFLFHNLALHHK